jgi:hypothetical protein
MHADWTAYRDAAAWLRDFADQKNIERGRVMCGGNWFTPQLQAIPPAASMLPWQRHKCSRASPEDHLRSKSGSLAKFTAMRLGAKDEEKRRRKASSPSRIRQMGERSPKRRQEDGRVRVLRILRERKAGPSRFPCHRQQMANRSPLASSRRSIEGLTLSKFITKIHEPYLRPWKLLREENSARVPHFQNEA